MVGKVRKCIWADERALLLFEARGLNLSTVVQKIMAGFLDLPDDPREKILTEKIDREVIRLRISYEQEIRDRIRSFDREQRIKENQEAATNQQDQELLEFYRLAKMTSCWSKIKTDLEHKNSDSHYWEIFLREMNEMNGRQWESNDLWNTGISWYQRFHGQPTSPARKAS